MQRRGAVFLLLAMIVTWVLSVAATMVAIRIGVSLLSPLVIASLRTVSNLLVVFFVVMVFAGLAKHVNLPVWIAAFAVLFVLHPQTWSTTWLGGVFCMVPVLGNVVLGHIADGVIWVSVAALAAMLAKAKLRGAPPEPVGLSARDLKGLR